MILFPKQIRALRVTGGYVRGEWVEDTHSEFTFIGDCQPYSYKDLLTLEVGRKDIGQLKVFSSMPLKVGLEGTPNSGDLVIWEGKVWEIVQEDAHQMSVLPHYRYRAEYRKEASDA